MNLAPINNFFDRVKELLDNASPPTITRFARFLTKSDYSDRTPLYSDRNPPRSKKILNQRSPLSLEPVHFRV